MISWQYWKFEEDFKHGAGRLVWDLHEWIMQVARELGIDVARRETGVR